MKSFAEVGRCLRVFAALLVPALPAVAQLDRATLTGSIRDLQGMVIPGAGVSIRNVATNAVYLTGATGVGQYAMPNLPVGLYELKVESEGCKTHVQGGIELRATEVVRVDVVLEVGVLTQSVQVMAEAPRLQTDSPQVGSSLSGAQLVRLPVAFSTGGARHPEDFAYKVTPGVTGTNYTSRINGSTTFSKETLLDGASVTVYRAGDFSQTATSLEAVREFRVQTSGMSAEFGRTQGGVFNYVMKSGTNEVHGTAFGALRNEALNANTFVNNARGEARPIDRKWDYAFSLGAPVVVPGIYDGHDRTFFYAAYEQFRDRSWGYRSPDRTVPLAEFYDGDFSRLLGPDTGFSDALGRSVPKGAIYDPATFYRLPNGRWTGNMFPGNRIPVSRFSEVSRRLNAIAEAHYLPTVRDAGGQVPLVNNATFPRGNVRDFDQYQTSIKVDQILGDAHKLSGSYAFNYRPRMLLDAGGMWDANEHDGGPLSKARQQDIRSHLSRLAYDTVLSARVLNHFMVYGNRMLNPSETVHKNVDGAKEIGIKGLSTVGYPWIGWGGGPAVTLQTPGDPQGAILGGTTWGVLNTVSLSRGRHFVKAGIDFSRSHLNNRTTSPGGTFDFRSLNTSIPGEPFSGNLTGYSFASYLLGIVYAGTRSDPLGLGGRRFSYASFVQDDFKVNSRLTLQLGLRWDFFPPALEAADRMATWTPSVVDPASGLPGAYEYTRHCSDCSGQRYFGRKDYRDFGPRIGFAWRAAPKLTVRGAYGIFYEADTFNGLWRVVPAGTGGGWAGRFNLSPDPVEPWRGIFNWDGGFPSNRYEPADFDRSFGNSSTPMMVDPEYGRSPRVHQWNLNIQRELFHKVVLDAGYLGRTATALRAGQLAKVNQLPASVLSTYGRSLMNPVRNAEEAAANGVKYPYPGYAGTVAGALREYPQVHGVSTVEVYGSPLGFATYHALQVVLNRQVGQDLTLYANYVWSKSLTNVGSSDPGGNSERPLDYYNLRLEKSLSESDMPHMFKAYLDYRLPVGRGKALGRGAGRFWNTLIGGWSVSAILNYASGTPLAFAGSHPLVGGWNGGTNRANAWPGDMTVGDWNKSKFDLSDLRSPNNTYLNKSAFSDPAPLALGTAAPRYAQARTLGTLNEDLGVQKNHPCGEKCRFQLRAEFLNAFNRSYFGGINTSVTSPLFGQVTTVSGNRTIQLGTRVDF